LIQIYKDLRTIIEIRSEILHKYGVDSNGSEQGSRISVDSVTNKYKSPCGAEGEENRDNPQGLFICVNDRTSTYC
jgi:hypothetical protein